MQPKAVSKTRMRLPGIGVPPSEGGDEGGERDGAGLVMAYVAQDLRAGDTAIAAGLGGCFHTDPGDLKVAQTGLSAPPFSRGEKNMQPPP